MEYTQLAQVVVEQSHQDFPFLAFALVFAAIYLLLSAVKSA